MHRRQASNPPLINMLKNRQMSHHIPLKYLGKKSEQSSPRWTIDGLPTFILSGDRDAERLTSSEQQANNMALRSSQNGLYPESRQRVGIVQGAESDGSGEALITHNDLLAVSTDNKLHISTLLEKSLEPINGQFHALNDFLKEVADTANRAYEMAAAQEKSVKTLMASEKSLTERMYIMELKTRALNIKFRGIPELKEMIDNLNAF